MRVMRCLAGLLFLWAAACGVPEAAAQKLVTVQSRTGVSVPIFVADTGSRRAEAVVLLFPGGGG